MKLFFIALLICCSGFAAEKTVITEGIADITGSLSDARENAVKDAKRQAVEQVVGVFIDSETMLENETILEDRIYTKAAGYVTDFKILKDENKKTYYKVKIQSTVNTDLVGNDLTAVIQSGGDPRVLIAAYINGAIKNDSAVYSMLADKMKAKGFRLVDKPVTTANKLTSLAHSDNESLQKLGEIYGADVSVNISVNTHPVGETFGMQSCGGELSLKAVRVASGEIIAAFSERCGAGEKIPPQLGLSLQQAESKVMTALCHKICDKTAVEIAKSLGNASRTIKMVAENCPSSAAAYSLKSSLEKIKGVSRTYIRHVNIENRIAEFDIDVDLSANADIIARKLSENYDIVEIALYKLRIKFK